jgi:hypothetical protein
MKIRHRFVDRSDDGVTFLESSFDTGSLYMGDQKLYVSPSTYPKLTVLLDRNYRITDIFGSMTRGGQSNAACIGYSSLPVLFFMPDGQKQHSIGDSWESALSLPTMGESLKIVNTLKGIEAADGESIAVVGQQISRTDSPLSNASVVSRFVSDDGLLLNSHVSCTVPDAAESKSVKNITIDITLSK